jgi:predicted amidohydrolase YtcJ
LKEAILFTGCKPEVAAFGDRIVAVGPRARTAAGKKAQVVRLRGAAWPGLIDSHIHLEGLADRKLAVDLAGTTSLADCLRRVKAWTKQLNKGAWVTGNGWYNDAWPERAFPTREQLDSAVGRRPACLDRKDGHSAWVSTEALRVAGIDRATPDPAGGSIDRDSSGEPTGILRETAIDLVARHIPPTTDADLDAALPAVLDDLAALGLTAVHSMDTARCLAALQRLRARGPLPVRVTYNLPVADLAHAERMGIRSGWGDAWLRVWGVKAFLDGSLGSRTAEMLDGSGICRLPQAELEEIAARCARAELNVCWHAIGDGAVRRALDALTPHRNAWRSWRPRIEHAQCVHPKDMTRMARLGVVASMQPIHAVSDRELADQEWPEVAKNAYAWRALERAGARLAFGSDAPVETADPLAGIEAATTWRKQAKWHPELALTRAAALRAYTADAAYAAGMEEDLGALRQGKLCDMTVIDGGRVEATVAGGRLTFRRKRA